ncbi:GNAT family N-acetyltransferase [Lactococcus fujiensis]|uniref:N-acetyltransferase domain-containing protein n=1 Tax=Lactococcus fujiensis JCM 16395 TaxID=1291764 RepID=A0A2A5RNR3_9LACT|nr:GNAT family N-acetyltransferase [Lactococcus fujiensis]PCS00958.1 hypothetical protein RT41_GL000748 [Lactococcus fujiensis JCM 16395]
MIVKRKKFAELSPLELYKLLQLRQEVFILEQECFYQDLDDKDQAAEHLWLENEAGQILAECRLIAKGVTFNDAVSIGRVITAPIARGKGLGIVMLKEAISQFEIQNAELVKIEAQFYAKAFYEKLGFEQISDLFLEDNIEHIVMQLKL